MRCVPPAAATTSLCNKPPRPPTPAGSSQTAALLFNTRVHAGDVRYLAPAREATSCVIMAKPSKGGEIGLAPSAPLPAPRGGGPWCHPQPTAGTRSTGVAASQGKSAPSSSSSPHVKYRFSNSRSRDYYYVFSSSLTYICQQRRWEDFWPRPLSHRPRPAPRRAGSPAPSRCQPRGAGCHRFTPSLSPNSVTPPPPPIPGWRSPNSPGNPPHSHHPVFFFFLRGVEFHGSTGGPPLPPPSPPLRSPLPAWHEL